MARLSLTDFRSYDRLDFVVPDVPLLALVGPNGAGKTNVLEALSLLAPGRGLRGATLPAMARHSAQIPPPVLAIHAQIMTDHGVVTLGTGQAEPGGMRRVARMNGAASSLGDFADLFALLWLTPAMDGLFREGASGRRRFLDRLTLALYPDHAGHGARYEVAMRERARLLENPQADPLWLTALEAKAAEQAVAIAAARRDTVASLCLGLAAMPDGAFPKARLVLEGAVENALETQKALAVEDWIAQELAARRDKDRLAGRASFGPHRSDLIAWHLPKDLPAALCSTGEQKALLIGLVLSHTHGVLCQTGRRSLLLLDEVVAHLDGDRRFALFQWLHQLGVQAWLTGTDAALFAGLGPEGALFAVDSSPGGASALTFLPS